MSNLDHRHVDCSHSAGTLTNLDTFFREEEQLWGTISDEDATAILVDVEREGYMRLPTALLILLIALPSSSITIHVPADAPTIQSGINAAQPGDVVLVACGTYYEDEIEMRSGVHLLSETGVADCVTIDAQGYGEVFTCSWITDTTIEGFTITGGFNQRGGGVLSVFSIFTINNCKFIDNSASGGGEGDGGGGLSSWSSNLQLEECAFIENGSNKHGGGIYINGGNLSLTNCLFMNNSIHNSGGGVYCYSSDPYLLNCRFIGNQAGGDYYDRNGGGLCCIESSPILERCVFDSNYTPGSGGAVFCGEDSSPVFIECLLKSNSASKGGGVYCWGGAAEIQLTTFVDNVGLYSDGIHLTLAPAWASV